MTRDEFVGYVGGQDDELHQSDVPPERIFDENWFLMLLPDDPGQMDPEKFHLQPVDEEWVVKREELLGGTDVVVKVEPEDAVRDQQGNVTPGCIPIMPQPQPQPQPDYRRAGALKKRKLQTYEDAVYSKLSLVPRRSMLSECPAFPRQSTSTTVVKDEDNAMRGNIDDPKDDDWRPKAKRTTTSRIRKKRPQVHPRGKLGRARKPVAKIVKGRPTKAVLKQQVPLREHGSDDIKPKQVNQSGMGRCPKKPTLKRKPRRNVPVEEQDEEYLRFRERNNVSARKCRAKKKWETLINRDKWEESFDTMNLPPSVKKQMREYQSQIGAILMAAIDIGRRYPAGATDANVDANLHAKETEAVSEDSSDSS